MSIAAWFVHSVSVLRRVGSSGAQPCLASARRASARTLRARRGGAGRSHGSYPPPTDPRSPHRATPLSHKRSLHPCTPLTLGRAPAFDTTQPPRRDDAREVHAGRGRRGRTVRGDCPRSGGHHLGVVCLGAQYGKYPVFNPLQKIPTARARAAVLRPLALVVPSERPWATRRPRSGGIHAPWTVERRAGRSLAPASSCHCAVGDAAAPGACAACAARARL